MSLKTRLQKLEKQRATTPAPSCKCGDGTICPSHQKETVRRWMTAEEWEAACEELRSGSPEVGCDESWLKRFGFA